MDVKLVKKYFPALAPFCGERPYRDFIQSRMSRAMQESKNGGSMQSEIAGCLDGLFGEGFRIPTCQQGDLVTVLYRLNREGYLAMQLDRPVGLEGAPEIKPTKFDEAVFTASVSGIERFMKDEKEGLEKVLGQFSSANGLMYVCKKGPNVDENEGCGKVCYGYTPTDALEMNFSCSEFRGELIQMPAQTCKEIEAVATLCKDRLEKLLAEADSGNYTGIKKTKPVRRARR